MTARSSGLLALIAVLLPSTVLTAPLIEQNTEMESYYPVADATGCYYNFHHYDEGDRIITNELCLNCTCHNRMLMCYLRVCPFIKAIGENCKVEKRTDQCCPVIICPEVPVKLLTSTTETSASSEVGHLDKYGCSIDKLFYSDGARVPSNPNKPCELCYCIRNKTACVMQECTLHIEGCKPVYQEGVCCPVKYDCDHPEDSLSETTTSPTPTTGLVFTTTLLPGVPSDCIHNGEIYADGALIKKETACEHCYCMKGDIVCAVQECGPTPLDKVNCTALPPAEGKCCPDTYDCEYVSEQELTTTYYELTTQAALKHEEENLISTTAPLLTKGPEYEKETETPELLQPTGQTPEPPKKEIPGEELEVTKAQTEFTPLEETQKEFEVTSSEEPALPEVLTEHKYLTTEAIQPVQTTTTYKEEESPSVLEHETVKEESVGTDAIPISETTAVISETETQKSAAGIIPSEEVTQSNVSNEIEPAIRETTEPDYTTETAPLSEAETQRSAVSEKVGIIPSEEVTVSNEIAPAIKETTEPDYTTETAAISEADTQKSAVSETVGIIPSEEVTQSSVSIEIEPAIRETTEPDYTTEAIKLQPEQVNETFKTVVVPEQTTVPKELPEELSITTQYPQIETATSKAEEETVVTDKQVVPGSTEAVPELKPTVKEEQPTESTTEPEEVEIEAEIKQHKPLESASHEATTQKITEHTIHPGISVPETTELPPEVITEVKQADVTEPSSTYSVGSKVTPTEAKFEVTEHTVIELEKSSTEETTESELITSLPEHDLLPEGAQHDLDHPEETEIPEEPETPVEPETPEEQETPEELEAPEEPETHTESEIHKEPETHEVPKTHEEPETHTESEIHKEPETHEVPETHEEPETHTESEIHKEPETHEVPETHTESEIYKPESHEGPETHTESEIHEEPETHGIPETHDEPETHTESEIYKPESHEGPETHTESELYKPETHERPETHTESEIPKEPATHEIPETQEEPEIHKKPDTYEEPETHTEPETHEQSVTSKEPEKTEAQKEPETHKGPETHEEPVTYKVLDTSEESTEKLAATTPEPGKHLEQQTEIISPPSEEGTGQPIIPEISETDTEKEITTESTLTVDKSHLPVESESATESEISVATLQPVGIGNVETTGPEIITETAPIPEELPASTQKSSIELTTQEEEESISSVPKITSEEIPIAEVEKEKPEIAESETTEASVVPVTEIPEVTEPGTRKAAIKTEENEITEKIHVEHETKKPLLATETAAAITEAAESVHETAKPLETTEAKQPEIIPTEPSVVAIAQTEKTTEQMEIVTEISDHTVKTMISLDHVTESEPRIPAKTGIEQETTKPEVVQACDESTGCATVPEVQHPTQLCVGSVDCAPEVYVPEIHEGTPELEPSVVTCINQDECAPEQKIPVEEVHEISPSVQQCESGIECGKPPENVPETQPCADDNLSDDCNKNIKENEILQDCINGDCKYSPEYPEKPTVELTTLTDEYDKVTEGVILEHGEKEMVPHEHETKTEEPTETYSTEPIPVISDETTQEVLAPGKDEGEVEEKGSSTLEYSIQTEPTQKVSEEIETETPHVTEHEPISLKPISETSLYSTESIPTISESVTEAEEPQSVKEGVTDTEPSIHATEKIPSEKAPEQAELPGLVEHVTEQLYTSSPELETIVTEEAEPQQTLTPIITEAEEEKLQHHITEEERTESAKPISPSIPEEEIKATDDLTTGEQQPEQEISTVQESLEKELTTVKYLPEELVTEVSKTEELPSEEPSQDITKIGVESTESFESTEPTKKLEEEPEKVEVTEAANSETAVPEKVRPTESAVSEHQTGNIQLTELPEKAEQLTEEQAESATLKYETVLGERVPAVETTTLLEHLVKVEAVTEKEEENTLKTEVEEETEGLSEIIPSKPEQPEVTTLEIETEAEIKPACEGDCVKEHPSVNESVAVVPERINEICKEEIGCKELPESTEKTILQTEGEVTPECLDHECKSPVESVIPGEGSCLVDGHTYENNSNVPPINRCQVSCRCVSSILICDSVACSPAPSNLENCMPIYHSLDSCCPTYSCTSPGTSTIKSDSHKVEEEITKAPVSEAEEKTTESPYVEMEREAAQTPHGIEEEQTTASIEKQPEIPVPVESQPQQTPHGIEEEQTTASIEKQPEIPVPVEPQPETPATEIAEPTEAETTEGVDKHLTTVSPPTTVSGESDIPSHEKVTPTEISEIEKETSQSTELGEKGVTISHALEPETEATTAELKVPEENPELATSDEGLKHQLTTVKAVEVVTESFKTTEPEVVVPTKHVTEDTELPIAVDEISAEEVATEKELTTSKPIEVEATEKIPEIEHKTAQPETKTEVTTSLEYAATKAQAPSLEPEKEEVTTPGKLEPETIPEIPVHPEETTEKVTRYEIAETTEPEIVEVGTTPISLIETESVKYPEVEASSTTPESFKDHEAPTPSKPEEEIVPVTEVTEQLEETTESEKFEVPSATQKTGVTDLGISISTVLETEAATEYPQHVTENVVTPEQPASAEHVTEVKEIEITAPEAASVTTEYPKYEPDGVTSVEKVTSQSQEITVPAVTPETPVLTKTGQVTAETATEESGRPEYVTEEISIPEKPQVTEIFEEPTESAVEVEEEKTVKVTEPELTTEKTSHPAYVSEEATSYELPSVTEKGTLQPETATQPEITGTKSSTEKAPEIVLLEHKTTTPSKIEGIPTTENVGYTEQVTNEVKTPEVPSETEEPIETITEHEVVIETESVAKVEAPITEETVPVEQITEIPKQPQEDHVVTKSEVEVHITTALPVEAPKPTISEEQITEKIESKPHEISPEQGLTDTTEGPKISEEAPAAIIEEVPYATVSEEVPEAVTEGVPQATVSEEVPQALTEGVPQATVSEGIISEDAITEEILKPTVSEGIVSEGLPEAVTEEIPKPTVSEGIIPEKEPEIVTQEIFKPTEKEPETVTQELFKSAEKEPEAVTQEILKSTEMEPEAVTEEILKSAEKEPETVTEEILKLTEKEPEAVTQEIIKSTEKELESVTQEAEVVTQEILKPIEKEPEEILKPTEKEPEIVTEKVLEPGELPEHPVLPKLTTQAPVSEVAEEITTQTEPKLNTSELFTSGTYSAPTTFRPAIPGELSTSSIVPSDLQPLLTTLAPDFHVTSTTFAPDYHPKEPTKRPLAPEPEEEYHHPDEEDYDEEEPGAFGPGTCRYSGKVYVSAQQIPRDDPCDFCFCFRSDIICLQQSCPPPIPKCHEEPIRGFCCPRYECPVSMTTAVNISTTTTTTTTTLPPHFLHHAYKGRATKTGCQIQGQAFRVGEVIKKASGPCLHCVCGGNGQMQCDPKVCSPEPILRQMIEAAVSRRR